MIYYYFNYRWRTGYIEYRCAEWWMFHSYIGYRHVKVSQENKRWFQDIEEGKEVKWRKGRRSPIYLDPWGELENYPSVYEMKSWKKLYKVKHQWEKDKREYIF